MIDRFAHILAAPVLAMAALGAVPAEAREKVLGVDTDYIELRKLESGSQSIEADRGYIFFHAPTRLVATFIKRPDEADKAAFREEWEEEYADAVEDYPRDIANWERDVWVAEQTRNNPPPKPIEPTRENFSIGNILFRNVMTAGPQYKFASDLDGQEYSYLTAVEPGTYIFYGNTMVYPAPAGVCLCMGTVQFEVKPGVITDLGNLPSIGGDATTLKFGLPGVLAAYASEVADLRAYGKIDNNYGIRIGRLPSLDGVIAYDRDRMIDLKAETQAETGEVVQAEAGGDADEGEAAGSDVVDTAADAQAGQGEVPVE